MRVQVAGVELVGGSQSCWWESEASARWFDRGTSRFNRPRHGRSISGLVLPGARVVRHGAALVDGAFARVLRPAPRVAAAPPPRVA